MDQTALASRRALSLAGSALRTLYIKARRDGLAEFSRALFQLCVAEDPIRAIIHHRGVVAFFNQPAVAALRGLPIANKYLSGYLAKSLNKRTRREVLMHNYRRLLDRAVPDFFQHVLSDSYPLWKMEHASGSYSIVLTFNRLSHYEGDLSLRFLSNDERIFEMSFALVPGRAVGSTAPELLFIGRVQGVKNRFEEVKQATKACRDVSPQHMLMMVMQAIARSLDVSAVAGVTDDDQLANLPNAHFRFNYSAFWENWTERAENQRFYEIPMPLPQTALGDIQASHRRRTKKKRQFKDDVAEQAFDNLRVIFPQQRTATAHLKWCLEPART